MTSDRPAIYLKAYQGKMADAMVQYERDAAHMAQGGYYPVALSYVAGSWGAGAYLVGVLLILLFGLGLLVLGYLIIVKPAGSLMVTYQLRTA